VQEAIADQLLRDMSVLNEQIGRGLLKTEQLRTETRHLRAEYLRMTEENRVALDRLKVPW